MAVAATPARRRLSHRIRARSPSSCPPSGQRLELTVMWKDLRAGPETPARRLAPPLCLEAVLVEVAVRQRQAVAHRVNLVAGVRVAGQDVAAEAEALVEEGRRHVLVVRLRELRDHDVYEDAHRPVRA